MTRDVDVTENKSNKKNWETPTLQGSQISYATQNLVPEVADDQDVVTAQVS